MNEKDDSDRTCGGDGRCVAKGVLAGLIGGLVGTIAMTQFQNAWSLAQKELKERQGETGRTEEDQEENSSQEEKEDATMKAAGKVAGLAGYELSHEQKKKAGPVVHYSFGTLQGGLYGAVLDLAHCDGGLVAGLILGAALFVAADEIGVPAAGLSGKPSETPLSAHLYGLASHLVYGVSAEFSRKLVRGRM